MNFASVTFLYFFLPLAIALYFLMPGRKAKNLFLLIASLIFYGWGEGFYIAILIGSIIFNHGIATKLKTERGRAWLFFGLIGNLALLITFKYANWMATSLGLAPGTLPDIHLPLGISFFTFQAISMLVDVYRGQTRARSILDTGLFIAMFPQLIAGPIVRFNEIRDDIYNRSETLSRFCDGIFIFVIGLAQKVLLADTLAIPADAAFSASPENLTASVAWIGLICFSLQIYYDFAGYSNMAIGLGRFFGFELPRNFDFPYSAASFREFWRRWHMTLSRWFRDYLYIPMGGSKTGRLNTYRNLLIVFVLCGIWHGAAWTFLLWGLWHGAFLIAERMASKYWPKVKIPRVFGMAYVCLFVTLGWVLFRADNIGHAMDYARSLSGLNQTDTPIALDMTNTALLALIFALALAWDGWTKFHARSGTAFLQNRPVANLLSNSVLWGSIGLLYILCYVSLASQTHNAFIYFRF